MASIAAPRASRHRVSMRFVLSLAAAAALAACATTPAAAPAAETPTVSAAPASSRITQVLADAGHANAPTRSEIEHALGQADIVRQEGAGAALTYRLNTCALLLLFQNDQRNALRLAEAHVSARQPGSAIPTLEQCASEASARRGS